MLENLLMYALSMFCFFFRCVLRNQNRKRLKEKAPIIGAFLYFTQQEE